MDHVDLVLFLVIVAGIVTAAIVIDIVQMIENASGIKTPSPTL